MTKEEAKEISIEVWNYLSDHPEIKDKEDLPEYLYEKIEYLREDCPLCEIFDGSDNCTKSCPLFKYHLDEFGNKSSNCHFFIEWYESKTDKHRKKYASIILNRIKKWKI